MNGAIPPLVQVVVCAGTILALVEQLANRNVEARECHIEQTTKM